MKIKKKHKVLIICFLIFTFLITGCADIDNVPTPISPSVETQSNSTEDDRDFEVYIEEEQYKYLEKVPLSSVNSYAAVYTIKGNESKGSAVSGEEHGISLDVNLIESDKELKEIIENASQDMQETLSIYGDLKISDMIIKENYGIQEMNYQIQEENVIYPCAVYIKTDLLSKGCYLLTIVQVDNTKTDNDTADLFSEILDAYGISLT